MVWYGTRCEMILERLKSQSADLRSYLYDDWDVCVSNFKFGDYSD